MKKYLPFILMFIAFSFLNVNCFAQKATINEVINVAERLSQQSYFQQNRLKSGQSVVIEKLVILLITVQKDLQLLLRLRS